MVKTTNCMTHIKSLLGKALTKSMGTTLLVLMLSTITSTAFAAAAQRYEPIVSVKSVEQITPSNKEHVVTIVATTRLSRKILKANFNITYPRTIFIQTSQQVKNGALIGTSVEEFFSKKVTGSGVARRVHMRPSAIEKLKKTKVFALIQELHVSAIKYHLANEIK
jgi:hypothetical protein